MFKFFFMVFLSSLFSIANIVCEEENLPETSLTSSIQPVEPQNPSNETLPDYSQEPPQLDTTTKTYESAFIKMILSLIGILIFVFIVFFLFKKFASSRIKQSNHFRTIKLLEKRAISPKSMLYLVEIGGKKILLAESQLEIRNVSNLEWIESEKKGL